MIYVQYWSKFHTYQYRQILIVAVFVLEMKKLCRNIPLIVCNSLLSK